MNYPPLNYPFSDPEITWEKAVCDSCGGPFGVRKTKKGVVFEPTVVVDPRYRQNDPVRVFCGRCNYEANSA